MAFEDYSPRDRRISGRAHLASWLLLVVLVGILAVALPLATAGDTGAGQIAATTPGDGQVPCWDRTV